VVERISEYELQDHIAVEVARFYCSECREPFFVAVGNHPDYDIVSLSRTRRIEIKCERAARRTQNVAIEFWNTSLNQPSGVLSSKADTWLHVVLEGETLLAYEYNIDTLRKLVIESGVAKDCGTNARCKIIPVETFRKFARRSFPFCSRFLDDIKAQAGV
jgi:hypothetical protein